MDIFKEVRERADILRLCDVLGIQLNRNYKAICPFPNHKEKTASFSISPSKNIFYCFGCGKKGNSITLVQELLNISPLESAKYINQILSLGININGSMPKYEVNRYKQIQEAKEKFKKWRNQTTQLLCDYLHSLKRIEKYQKQDIVEYYIDLLIFGTEEDCLWFKKAEENYIKKINSTLKK